ncbi:hypothetical protein K502DRAFT_346718 [Neoconidiobolus thromboides FSU 785]|nr:hypothetical protein K502DRAFT_346718 [Neoconidiobolus thromboides FSU 785]
MSIESESTIKVCSSNRFVDLKKATVKVCLISTVYGTCMLSSLIFLLFGLIFNYNYRDSFKYPEDFDSATTLLFVFGMIFNTLLILTLHIGISNEVKEFMQKTSNK